MRHAALTGLLLLGALGAVEARASSCTVSTTPLAFGAYTSPGGASGSKVNGSITTGLLSLLCLQGTRNHTVYGRLPASQSVPAGSYADQVVLTVTY